IHPAHSAIYTLSLHDALPICLLVAPGENRASSAERIVHAARKLCADEGYPTWQVLFPDEAGAREIEQAGMALRVSWQFHWRNERSEEHTSELQSPCNLVCRLL